MLTHRVELNGKMQHDHDRYNLTNSPSIWESTNGHTWPGAFEFRLVRSAGSAKSSSEYTTIRNPIHHMTTYLLELISKISFVISSPFHPCPTKMGHAYCMTHFFLIVTAYHGGSSIQSSVVLPLDNDLATPAFIALEQCITHSSTEPTEASPIMSAMCL